MDLAVDDMKTLVQIAFRNQKRNLNQGWFDVFLIPSGIAGI